ncbi:MULTISPECIES: CAP domain-containing protein [unclassified Lysinibacillus]|uniref:CAP domain-containing protein n=1 Tax=unclassified Lysinibacillus TaxID=2636778 RepID=UPI00255747A2|nr:MULTISPECIES: CAP domain-containing protein [unclassified Lysinibacillus]MDM5248306.1 CAP domain-containing protein [Lysinibacillus sp. G4S2]
MKKTLTAICATFLLAAPIQMASAASNTTEGNSVKETTDCNKVYYYKWSNQWSDQWSNQKWYVNLPQTQVPSKETQAPSKEVQKPSDNTQTKNNNTQTTQKDNTSQSTTTSDVNAFEQEVVKLTNAERTKAGLAPFKTDDQLMAAAREKSQDMQSKNYFSHTSPTFGSPFDRMKALGISYKSAGENIAQGQRTPQEVVQAWMDSPGHRANILNEKFTHIGVGYVKSGNYWTQQFIQK